MATDAFKCTKTALTVV